MTVAETHLESVLEADADTRIKAARAIARERYGTDCRTQIVDGYLQARPYHGLEWTTVAKVGPSGDPLPVVKSPGKTVPELLRELGYDE